MKEVPAVHTSFVIERSFDAMVEDVYQAWADPDVKRQWSDCHAEHTVEFSLDFRPHGHETHRVRHPEHGEQVVEKHFLDIQPGRRIVFAYDISVGGKTLSASLVTVEFIARNASTLMVYTEQIAYLDGHHDLEQRIQGTGEGLDKLRLAVERNGGLAQ